MWGADWKFRHEGNCSASRGLPSDTEQLLEWRNFQFSSKIHYGFFFLRTLYSTIAFRLVNECVLFYQIYAKNNYIFRSRKIRYGFSLIRWHRNVLRKLTWKWRQDIKNDVKIVILTSCTSRLTPHVRRHFLAPVGFTEIPVGYAVKAYTISQKLLMKKKNKTNKK